MAEINAYCSICGKGYHMCKTCREQKQFKPWRSIVDSIEHYKIYMILSDYTNKRISKASAKAELEKCDLTTYKSFVPNIVQAIDDILEADKATEKVSEKIAKKATVTNVKNTKNSSITKNSTTTIAVPDEEANK